MDWPVPPEVVEHYAVVDEATRLADGHQGRLELLRTQEILRRVLPPGPLELADVGGGAGVDAAWLAGEDGHTVHVVDPVPGHALFAARALELSLPAVSAYLLLVSRRPAG